MPSYTKPIVMLQALVGLSTFGQGHFRHIRPHALFCLWLLTEVRLINANGLIVFSWPRRNVLICMYTITNPLRSPLALKCTWPRLPLLGNPTDLPPSTHTRIRRWERPHLTPVQPLMVLFNQLQWCAHRPVYPRYWSNMAGGVRWNAGVGFNL